MALDLRKEQYFALSVLHPTALLRNLEACTDQARATTPSSQSWVENASCGRESWAEVANRDIAQAAVPEAAAGH